MLKRLALVLLAAGCGGKTINPLDDGGSDDGSVKKDVVVIDVGPPTDAPPPPPPIDGGPQCNNVDPGTKAVSVMQVPQNPPPFAGTSTFIQPGLYELVSLTLYTGPNGPSGSQGTIAGEIRVNVANSADYIFQVGSVQDNQASMHSNSDGNSAGAGVLTIAQTCPQPEQAVKVLYTASSQAFMLRIDTGSVTADEKFDYIGP